MKKLIYILCVLFGLMSFSTKEKEINECEIEAFYQEQNIDSEALVLTSFNELKEVETLLVPTTMDEGVFETQVTRMANDLYKMNGTNYYIKTKYCHEYANREDVILKVESNYGYTKGNIIFNP